MCVLVCVCLAGRTGLLYRTSTAEFFFCCQSEGTWSRRKMRKPAKREKRLLLLLPLRSWDLSTAEEEEEEERKSRQGASLARPLSLNRFLTYIFGGRVGCLYWLSLSLFPVIYTTHIFQRFFRAQYLPKRNLHYTTPQSTGHLLSWLLLWSCLVMPSWPTSSWVLLQFFLYFHFLYTFQPLFGQTYSCVKRRTSGERESLNKAERFGTGKWPIRLLFRLLCCCCCI